MPYTLLDRHTVPHGGFRFWVKESRTSITSATLWYCAEAVLKHRRANELPGKDQDMETTMSEIEAQLCESAPPETCRDKEGAVKMHGTAMSFDTITRGAETLLDFFVKDGRKKVSKEIADERARVCGNCFANKNPEGCTSCAGSWLRELANQITGGEDTAHDAVLKSCAFCGCLLRSKVWIPLNTLLAHTPEAEFNSLPETCWQKIEKAKQDAPPAQA